jgi:hypothetical protein
MSGDAVSERGELRILGMRLTAIDAQSLCNHLDSLVGVKVGEVIMHNLEFRLGKLDAARLRAEKPGATLNDLVEHLRRTDQLTGVGMTTVKLPDNPGDHVEVEVANPSVKGTMGAAKSFIFSYWAGALTALLDKEFDMQNVVYDNEKDLMKCLISPRDAIASKKESEH